MFLCSNHAEVLIYDWSDEGDTEVVVEDIERVNFNFDKNDPKLADWSQPDEWEWCHKRMMWVGNTVHAELITYFSVIPFFPWRLLLLFVCIKLRVYIIVVLINVLCCVLRYTSKKDRIMNWMNVPDFSIPELVVDADDHKKFQDLWWNVRFF